MQDSGWPCGLTPTLRYQPQFRFLGGTSRIATGGQGPLRSHAEYKGHVTLPKHDKIRTVPMTKRLAAALRDLDRTHPTVFAREDGRLFSSRMIERRLTHAEREAGLREKGPHTLRHSFCSHLAMRGVPARVIMQLAGHSQLETTLNYMHLSPGAVETAIAALEEPPPRQGISQHPVRGEAGGDMLETVRPPLVGPQ